MTKLLPLILLLFLFSCQNGNTQSQKKLYTEEELQRAILKAKDEQQKVDETAEAVASAARATMEPTTTITPAPQTYYVFAALVVSFGIGEENYQVLTTEIIERTHKPTRDEEYKILDDLTSSPDVQANSRVYKNFKTHKRKVYSFNSYADASEKRQEVLSKGIQ
ncbi:hypothetical protein [Edaphocola flava]|uniref:hypothetical protein n=1 Tax=Edaphocola flava TaxID=2499629 RepID=UPI00100BE46B|nr:hypothetical protein [Edaphocola flava]